MSKRYVVMVTDQSGNTVQLFETDSKASAANKARGFKKDGAYAAAEVIDTKADLAEVKPIKGGGKGAKPKAPKAPRQYKINFANLAEAMAHRQDEDERDYITWVRREAPKALGMTTKDFVEEFGRGHVMQADVILLHEQADDKVWDFFISNPTRNNLYTALDDAGLESTRITNSRVPKFGAAREEWLAAYREKMNARKGGQ
jgi:hypothetical protein